MTRSVLRASFAAVLAVAATGSPRAQDGDATLVEATLDGFQEVPSVSTAGSGTLKARIVGEGTAATVEFQLTYSGLTGPPSVAHIHFAQTGVSGEVSVFLCGGGNKQPCPAEGTLSGTLSPQDVTGPVDRGLAAGDMEAFVNAILAGAAYANVHTQQFPDGEIRGQLKEPEPTTTTTAARATPTAP